MLLIHIIVSLLTIGLAGVTLFSTSRKKIKASYLLTALTFATGSYLVIQNPAHLVSACITGIIFLGVVGFILYLASQRLSKIPPRT